MMNKQVVVRFQIAGLHSWPDCNIHEVNYLQHTHRHNFHFEAKANVTHDNRDIEFIVMQGKIKAFLMEKFYNEELCAMVLGANSCESLAGILLEEFKFLSEVSVFEDGENGATLWRE